jgi:hypothetical protein
LIANESRPASDLRQLPFSVSATPREAARIHARQRIREFWSKAASLVIAGPQNENRQTCLRAGTGEVLPENRI